MSDRPHVRVHGKAWLLHARDRVSLTESIKYGLSVGWNFTRSIWRRSLSPPPIPGNEYHPPRPRKSGKLHSIDAPAPAITRTASAWQRKWAAVHSAAGIERIGSRVGGPRGSGERGTMAGLLEKAMKPWST